MSNPPDWLGPATDLLKQHGLDEAAEALMRARPEIADRQAREIESLTHQLAEARQARGSREVDVRIHPGIDRRLPAIRDAVMDWVSDPAPKLDGLIVVAWTGDSGLGPGVEIFMQRGVGDRRWREVAILDDPDLTGQVIDLPRFVGMHLESMHRRMIEAIRNPGGQS